MIQIRRNVFETNSSSTHSITICTKEDYTKFSQYKLYFVDWGSAPKSMMTFDEAISYLRSRSLMDAEGEKTVREMYNNNDTEGVGDYLRDYEVYDYDTYGREGLEGFYEEFTTPGGEKIVAFGQYGYDG